VHSAWGKLHTWGKTVSWWASRTDGIRITRTLCPKYWVKSWSCTKITNKQVLLSYVFDNLQSYKIRHYTYLPQNLKMENVMKTLVNSSLFYVRMIRVDKGSHLQNKTKTVIVCVAANTLNMHTKFTDQDSNASPVWAAEAAYERHRRAVLAMVQRKDYQLSYRDLLQLPVTNTRDSNMRTLTVKIISILITAKLPVNYDLT
jgi:hypothetical protein